MLAYVRGLRCEPICYFGGAQYNLTVRGARSWIAAGAGRQRVRAAPSVQRLPRPARCARREAPAPATRRRALAVQAMRARAPAPRCSAPVRSVCGISVGACVHLRTKPNGLVRWGWWWLHATVCAAGSFSASGASSCTRTWCWRFCGDGFMRARTTSTLTCSCRSSDLVCGSPFLQSAPLARTRRSLASPPASVRRRRRRAQHCRIVRSANSWRLLLD